MESWSVSQAPSVVCDRPLLVITFHSRKSCLVLMGSITWPVVYSFLQAGLPMTALLLGLRDCSRPSSFDWVEASLTTVSWRTYRTCTLILAMSSIAEFYCLRETWRRPTSFNLGSWTNQDISEYDIIQTHHLDITYATYWTENDLVYFGRDHVCTSAYDQWCKCSSMMYSVVIASWYISCV